MTPPHDSQFEAPSPGNQELIMYRLEKLEEGQAHLVKGQADLERGQNAILDELRKVPRCPSPGLCLVTQKETDESKKKIEGLTEKVASLETDRARVQGAQWAVKIVWGVIGFVVSSGLLGLVYTLFQMAHK